MSVRFVTAVFPSEDDDVITSPYNSVLAMRQLAEHADCVLPVENQVRLIKSCRVYLLDDEEAYICSCFAFIDMSR